MEPKVPTDFFAIPQPSLKRKTPYNVNYSKEEIDKLNDENVKLRLKIFELEKIIVEKDNISMLQERLFKNALKSVIDQANNIPILNEDQKIIG